MSIFDTLPATPTIDEVRAMRDLEGCSLRQAQEYLMHRYRQETKAVLITALEDITEFDDLKEALIITLQRLV